MKISEYSIDLEKAVNSIKKNDYKRVVLQIPDGLIYHFSKFVNFLEEKTDSTIIISADPCFGACDVVNSELKNMDIDFVIQIGHTPIPSIKDFDIPILFLNAESNLEIKELIEKAIPYIEGKKVGLISTSQHVHLLNDAGELLISKKFDPIIGKGDNRIYKKGQILGCNFSAAKSIIEKVDSFLFIGSGNFHPLGLILITKKPVIACDPYTNKIRKKELDDLKDMILRQRYGAIARSKDARVFGILVGLKRGQQRFDYAYNIKEKLNSQGKKSYIFVLNYFSPSIIENFKEIDCFISTACPRIAIDDYMQYKVPIITPVELDILLGIKKWDDYTFDEILE